MGLEGDRTSGGGGVGRICNAPGCTEVVYGKNRFCGEHRQGSAREYYERMWNNPRRSKKRALYSGERWRRLRLAKMRHNPACEMCTTRMAQEVHHVKPVEEFPELIYDVSNLQSLCRACHFRATVKEMEEVRGVKNKTMWLPDLKDKAFRMPVTVVHHQPIMHAEARAWTTLQMTPGELLVDLVDLIDRIDVSGSRNDAARELAGRARKEMILALTESVVAAHAWILASRLSAQRAGQMVVAGAVVKTVVCDEPALVSRIRDKAATMREYDKAQEEHALWLAEALALGYEVITI